MSLPNMRAQPYAAQADRRHHARGFNESAAFALQRKQGREISPDTTLLKSVGIANQLQAQDPSRAIHAAARS